jgi:hypothetical protein
VVMKADATAPTRASHFMLKASPRSPATIVSYCGESSKSSPVNHGQTGHFPGQRNR